MLSFSSSSSLGAALAASLALPRHCSGSTNASVLKGRWIRCSWTGWWVKVLSGWNSPFPFPFPPSPFPFFLSPSFVSFPFSLSPFPFLFFSLPYPTWDNITLPHSHPLPTAAHVWGGWLRLCRWSRGREINTSVWDSCCHSWCRRCVPVPRAGMAESSIAILQ